MSASRADDLDPLKGSRVRDDLVGQGGEAAVTPHSVDSSSDLLRPVKVQRTSDQIVDRLVTAVALGEVVAGQKLPAERDLAAMMAVSRATLREALQQLTALGYLEIRRGRGGGAFVRSTWTPSSPEILRRALLPDEDRLRELFEFQQILEPQVARAAATGRTEEDVEALQKALAAYRVADDREQSRAGDEALHSAVARATHNRYLVGVSHRIHSEVTFGLRAYPYSRDIRKQGLADHIRLVEAIIDGDSETAEAVAESHFEPSHELIRELLDTIRVEQASGKESD